MGVEGVLRNVLVEQGSIPRDAALVIVFVAVSSKQKGAIGGAVYGDFALGAAAYGANLFSFGGAKTLGFALFTNRTRHGVS